MILRTRNKSPRRHNPKSHNGRGTPRSAQQVCSASLAKRRVGHSVELEA